MTRYTVTGATLLCGWAVWVDGAPNEPCPNPSVCGLKHGETGFIVNVCRKHFAMLKDREFGSEPEDFAHYREQAVLL